MNSSVSISPDKQARIDAALLSFACGDALGMATEFMTRDQIERAFPDGVTRLLSQKDSQNHGNLTPGSVTDDTEQVAYLLERYRAKGQVTVADTVDALLVWIRETRAVEKHYIGPSSLKALTAIENGAAEVDMVINIGRLKNGEYDAVREDIRAVKQAVGDKVLKVIIETCLLTDDEKRKMCDIVREAGADYIKTSTGFSTAGATFHDVELMVKGVHGRCKVKAAGGISTVEDMETFLALGADRLGTSRAVKILNGEQAKGY